MKKNEDFLYKIYYRIYYFLIAIWKINHPNVANPPKENFIKCRFYFDPDQKGEKHHNFLIVPRNYQPENRWQFFKRHFAFKFVGKEVWFEIPGLTIHEITDSEIKYGLNHTLVNKYQNRELEFITW